MSLDLSDMPAGLLDVTGLAVLVQQLKACWMPSDASKGARQLRVGNKTKSTVSPCT